MLRLPVDEAKIVFFSFEVSICVAESNHCILANWVFQNPTHELPFWQNLWSNKTYDQMADALLAKAEAALKEQKYEDAVELFTEVS